MLANEPDNVQAKPPWRCSGLPDEGVEYVKCNARKIFDELCEAVQVGYSTSPRRGIAQVSAVCDEMRSAGKFKVAQ